MAEIPDNDKEKGIKPYLRYSGLAFQMIGVLVVAAWAGSKLDESMGSNKPWFTIGLLVVAVIASMLMVILSLNKK